MKVAILGATGMLGSMVLRYLSLQPDLELVPATRAILDAERADLPGLIAVLSGCSYAINCIGTIKPHIGEADSRSVKRAIQVNALFPRLLAQAAGLTSCRVLQIATDCVFSGRKGPYDELAPHDPEDVYGKTKSLGEMRSPGVYHLRCSIIGPEQKGHTSLLDWFLGQPRGASVSGYTNHFWNGITTLAFAKICCGIMRGRINLPSVQHIVPFCPITKAELLYRFAEAYGRTDIRIEETNSQITVNRSLVTLDIGTNLELWKAAGYDYLPTISYMVKELEAYR